MAAYEVLLLNTAVPQIQAAQSGDTYVVPRDIAFSAALTLSAGTANGVPYLNGSKVLTTGSALTYNGTALTSSASGAISGIFNRDTSSGATLQIQVVGNNVGTLGSDTGGNGRFDLAAATSMQLRATGSSSFMSFDANNTEQMRLTSTGLTVEKGAVFNESGADSDFRVESDTNTHALFVDAGNNAIGVLTSAPTAPLEINSIGGLGGYTALKIKFGSTSVQSLSMGQVTAGNGGWLGTAQYRSAGNWQTEGTAASIVDMGADGTFTLYTNSGLTANTDFIPTQRLTIPPTTGAVFNEDGLDYDFRVESDSNTHMLFVDGGGNWVSIGGNTRGYAADLTVDGNGGVISCYDANGGIYFGTGGGGFGANPAIARASTANFHISSSAVGDLCIGAETNTLIRFGTSTSGTPSTRMTIAANGDVNVVGALSKGSGSFRIDHPLPSKKDTHQLVHSFVEAPQADLIYRGKAQLVSGRVVVNLDQAAGMTEGTFVVLCRDVQCFTSNEQDWDAVRGSVSGNILTIECQNPTSAAVVSWMVIGERQDPHMYETDWTDENGKVIVEPLKPIDAVS